MLRKRLSLALSLLVISGCVIAATRYITGQPNEKSNALRVKVLREKEHLKNKPTGQEFAAFKAATEKEERKLEDEIPKHIPLKIKIKEEKEFKDLKNENWARDFVLEVTNTSKKPIYYLSLHLITDVITAKGSRIVFSLSFGRVELSDIRVAARPADIVISPGETYSMKFHPGELQGWEQRNREEKRPHPKKIRVVFQIISFGDGTGYAGTEGFPLPRKISRLTSPRPGSSVAI